MIKVVVIGAGPAGLTAAFELLKRGGPQYSVTVLEASQSIGGISRTVVHNGHRMDIGGHRFFSKNQEVMNWWAEHLPLQGAPALDDLKLMRQRTFSSDGPNPEVDDKVMLLRNRISRILFDRKFFDYPLSIKLSTFINMGILRTLSAGFSYCKSSAIKRQEKTLEDFYINRFGKTLYSMFFESYTEKVWGMHPSQLSADWGAQRIKSLSIFKLFYDCLKKMLGLKRIQNTETSLIEEFWYPKFGPGQLWETIANEVEQRGGHIYKGYEVIQIHCKNGSVQQVTCSTSDGYKKIDADIVISSMALKDIVNIINEPCPDEIANIAQNLPYRDFITVGILTHKLNIRNKTNIQTLGNIIPDCWIYIQEKDVKIGRLQIFNNWSPYLLIDPENTVWLGLEYFCTECDALWNKNSHEMIDFAIQELSHIGIINPSDIIDSHCEKVKKAYPAYFGSYAHIDKLRQWLTNINGLYCVGRNGQHRYNNMDHSMLTSFFCIDHILGHKKNKQEIWNINAEKIYHETK